MKLALGTVQFGLDYGISNTRGQVSSEEVGYILEYARASGIDTLDTAQAYGESQKVLGRFDLSGFKIVSKMTKEGRVEDSLAELGIPRLYAMMLHREDELNDESFNMLIAAKQQKMVQKIGVSVYSPVKLDQLITGYSLDIVQLPLNLLDQRFVPLLPKLKEKGIEIHTRSAFLQGLLLMNANRIPEYFEPIKPILRRIPESKLAMSLNFVKNIDAVDKTVVGVTSKKDLEEVCFEYNKNAEEINYSEFKITDEKFLNPSKWELN